MNLHNFFKSKPPFSRHSFYFYLCTLFFFITFSTTNVNATEDEDFRTAINDAIFEITNLYNYTEPKLFQKFELSTHMPYARNAWMAHTYSSAQAKTNAYPGYILSRASQLLKSKNPHRPLSSYQLDYFKQTQICKEQKIECDASTTMYRSHDGTCNNVKKPQMGSTFVAFRRELPPDYSDGISELRHSSSSPSEPLPNPRRLSNAFFSGKVRKGDGRVEGLTALFVHWSMFVYTDMVHIGSLQLIQDDKHVPLPCCESEHPECRAVSVGEDDPLYGGFVACLDYPRSLVATHSKCNLTQRQQANQATSFLDASQLYGSVKERADSLRTFRGGKMKVSSDISNNLLKSMPLSIDRPLSPSHTMKCPDGVSCFLSGSEHTNFLPTLVALHTLWLRQHNRIAQILMNQNKKWSDEQLYQESRRIVIAQIQHITYNEFLPLLIGREMWQKEGMAPNEGEEEKYDMKVDATVMNAYASVVGQFFYTMLGDKIAQYHSEGFRTMERPLSEYINKPKLFLFGEDINGILRFLIRDKPEPFGLHMPGDVRGRLFKGTTNMGIDLATMLLQLGRDHGIPAYVQWREHCGGSHVTDFDDLRDILQGADELLPLLKRHYKSVRDIDLLILGLAERPEKGAIVGPTFACLIAKQFENTKRGDRFWYENTVSPWGFSPQQLEQIRKTTIAQVICENANLELIQPMAFKSADKKDNFPLLCNVTQSLKQSFEAWRDVEPQIEMPVTMQTVRKAIEIGMNVVMERRKRESQNIRENQGKFKKHDPIYAYGQMMRAKKEAVEQSKLSSVLLEATKALMFNNTLMENSPLNIRLDPQTLQRLLPQIDVSEFLGNIGPFMGSDGSVAQCLPQELPCDHTSPYRTYSGWCNNLRFPHYGNAFGPLRHLFEPEYADGIDEPRKSSVMGSDLPMAREVSNALHNDQAFDDEKFTHMVMQFGQFLDHEVTHSPVERGPNDEILNCSRCDSPDTLSIHCMPLHVPQNDPMHPTHDSEGERRCFPMARSLLGQLSLGYRNQLNQLTAYLDASVIYGSTQCEASALRLFHGGLLNFTNIGEHNSEALPQGDQEQDCRSKPRFPCFVAGDERNSHQPGLTTMHNIWMREHNRLARALTILNPKWDDEKLYQEVRKIVGGMFQHIVYAEYLPKLIGKRYMEKYDLEPQKSGYFNGYDDTCDAAISHPFATAAFRFGHTLIRRHFPRLNTVYKNMSSPVDLQEHFNNVEPIYDKESGGLDSILIGLLGTRCMAFDRHITDAVRNHLFQLKGWPLSGFDLISLNIMRARDHGVQGYNKFREFCGLRKARSFSDLSDEMDEKAIESLESVYRHVDDIDLFPGLLSEKPMGGALMPPTMACLIAEQFQRLKKCDRFYYENEGAETRFGEEQLNEIRKIKLGSILCQNSRMLSKIQPDVFSIPDDLDNAQIPCTDFPKLNLNRWMDRPVCYIGNSEVPRGSTKLKSPCVRCTCTGTGPICRAIKVLDCKNLLDHFLLADIKADVTCVVQCASFIKNAQ